MPQHIYPVRSGSRRACAAKSNYYHDYEVLLRVPGIGVHSAQRIVQARHGTRLGEAELKKLGVVLKRARYFLTAGERYLGGRLW